MDVVVKVKVDFYFMVSDILFELCKCWVCKVVCDEDCIEFVDICCLDVVVDVFVLVLFFWGMCVVKGIVLVEYVLYFDECVMFFG